MLYEVSFCFSVSIFMAVSIIIIIAGGLLESAALRGALRGIFWDRIRFDGCIILET